MLQNLTESFISFLGEVAHIYLMNLFTLLYLYVAGCWGSKWSFLFLSLSFLNYPKIESLQLKLLGPNKHKKLTVQFSF